MREGWRACSTEREIAEYRRGVGDGSRAVIAKALNVTDPDVSSWFHHLFLEAPKPRPEAIARIYDAADKFVSERLGRLNSCLTGRAERRGTRQRPKGGGGRDSSPAENAHPGTCSASGGASLTCRRIQAERRAVNEVLARISDHNTKG